MTRDVLLETFDVKFQMSRSQRKNVVGYNRQIIAFFQEIGVSGSNGDVRILIGGGDIAVCTHAQYKMAKQISTARMARRRADLQIATPRNCHLF